MLVRMLRHLLSGVASEVVSNAHSKNANINCMMAVEMHTKMHRRERMALEPRGIGAHSACKQPKLTLKVSR